MTQVNTPYGAARRRPVKELSKSMNGYLDVLETSIQNLYRRSGGAEDGLEGVAQETHSNDTAISKLRSDLNKLKAAVNDLHQDAPPDNFALLLSLEKRISALESIPHISSPWQMILKRLEAIEAQL